MSEQLEKISFSLSYDGADTLFANHQIKASDLANIISSMNDLILKSDQIFHGRENKEPLITVTSPIREGSVIIDFLLSCADTTKIKKTMESIGLIGGADNPSSNTLIGFIAKNGNQKPMEIIKMLEDDNGYLVKLENGQKAVLSSEVLKLVENNDISQDMNDIFYKPAQQSSPVSIKVLSKDTVITTLDQTEINQYKHLEMSLEDEDEEEKDIIKTIRFGKVNLRGTKKSWTMYFQDNNDQEIHVHITDLTFLERVKEAKYDFNADRLFKVKMDKKILRKGLKQEKVTYTITNVIKQYGGDDPII